MEKQSLKWVDSLKGIAIIGVFLIHCGTDVFPNTLFSRFCSYGYLGVDIFFIINSFLCLLSFSKHSQSIAPHKFLLNNILRILPLYYLSMPFKFSEYHFNLDAPAIIAQFAFVGWVNPNWYFYNGWTFSIVVGWIYFLIVRNKIKSMSNTIIVSAITIFLIYLTSIFTKAFLPNYGFDCQYVNILSDGMLRVIIDFSLGFILYQVYKIFITIEFKERKKTSIGIICFILLIFSQILIENNHVSTFYFSILLFLIIFSQLLHQNIFITNPIFSFLGKYTWGFYLFHIYVYWFLKDTLHFKKILLLILSFIFTVVISFLLNKIVEVPFWKLTKRRFLKDKKII